MEHFMEVLIVAIVFGSITSIVLTALLRGRITLGSKQFRELSERVAALEAGRPAALPAHDDSRTRELEQRLQAVETIVTGADELLERRLREAAEQKLLLTK